MPLDMLQVQNADQDIRYMAVSDLTKELEKEAYKPDAASQKKIVQGLVSVITNDTASEVRSCVIKWYETEAKSWSFPLCLFSLALPPHYPLHLSNLYSFTICILSESFSLKSWFVVGFVTNLILFALYACLCLLCASFPR